MNSIIKHSKFLFGFAMMLTMLISNTKVISKVTCQEQEGDGKSAEIMREYTRFKMAIGEEEIKLALARSILAENPRIALIHDRYGCTPLHDAAFHGNMAIIEALLATYQSIGNKQEMLNRQDQYGYTALYWAVLENKPQAVKLLLQQGADPNIPNYEKEWSPLHCAVMRGYILTAQDLVAAGANVNSNDSDGETPLHKAASLGNLNLVKLFVSSGALVDDASETGVTALHKAVEKNHLAIVQFLAKEKKSLVNTPDASGQTAIHKARSPEITQELINQGSDINAQDGQGETLLHLAAQAGNHVIVKMLIKNKAALNIKDNTGSMPIDEAFYNKHSIIVQMLLNAGAIYQGAK